MPSLVYEQSGSRRGGIVDGRVLIGRKLSHGVVITDPTVSRLHAWIDNREGTFVLTDAGSRTGTFVNGEAIVRWELQNGDQIKIGPVALTYSEEAQLPEGVESLDFGTAGAVVSSKSGILFDCKCGAPLWVETKHAGKRGLCKYCGERVQVPTPAGISAARAAESPKPAKRVRPLTPQAKCGVCHSHIDDGEETTRCPECGTTFHTDCWMENYGCSSYGCAQVNALKPPEVAAEEAAQQEAMIATSAEVAPEAAAGTPWDLLLLAGSVVGSVIGSLMFGAPAIIIALASAGRLVTGKSQRRGVLALAVLLSAAGVAGGLALSDFWWFRGEHLALLRR